MKTNQKEVIDLKRIFVLTIIMLLSLYSICVGFYLYIGQEKTEVIAAIGEPNYTEISVSINGKIERCQWGSERAGTMVVIYFKDGKVIRFETKGKVN